MTPDSLRIACVIGDDHEAAREGLRRALAEGRVEVVGCTRSGEEALALIEEKQPGVALLALSLPGLGAIEVVRRVGRSAAKTAVIVYADQALGWNLLLLVLRQALEAGARGFLLRHSPLADLLPAVESVACGYTYVDPALGSALTRRQGGEGLPRLSERQLEVLRLLADGLKSSEVAERLSISPGAVEKRVRSAIATLGARTRTQAVASALRLGLLA